MDTTTLSRQDLYDRIWAKPAKQLAQELGISMARLVKVCEENGVPRPPSEYWGGLKWGKEYERPSLAPAESPEKEQVVIEPSRTRPKDDFPPVPVPTRIIAPHPVVAAALKMLERPDRDQDGLAYSGARDAVKIVVAPKNIQRAVRIMDAFVKEMVKNGFEFEARDVHAYAGVMMKKADRHYPLKLREHMTQSQLPLTPEQAKDMQKLGYCFGKRTKQTPDGQLVLTFGDDYNGLSCQDTANTRLEDKLGRFVGRVLQKIADGEARRRRFKEEEAERQRVLVENRRREEEEARLRREEEDRVATLKKTIACWRLSQDIREYVQEMRHLIASHEAKASRGGPLANWMEWASGYADRIDPFGPLKEQLLKIQAMQEKQG